MALKLAVVAESRLDEAVAREIVAHVRGEAAMVVDLRERPPGVSAIMRRLPVILRQAFLHTDADAVAVLADGDLTPRTVRRTIRSLTLRAVGVRCTRPPVPLSSDCRRFLIGRLCALPSAWRVPQSKPGSLPGGASCARRRNGSPGDTKEDSSPCANSSRRKRTGGRW